MARITRPQFNPVQTGGGISPTAGSATIGQSGQVLGQTLKAYGDQFFQEADTANANAVYSKNFRQASEEFLTAVGERSQVQFDKDGNPIFDTLSKDVGQIGDEIKSKYLGKILHPKASNKFDENFSNLVTNNVIKSQGVARKQQIDFIRQEESESFDTYLQLALDAQSPTERDFAVDSYLDQLRRSGGAFTPAEIKAKEQEFLRQYGLGKANQVIKEDPFLALETLEQDPSAFGLTRLEDIEAAKKQAYSQIKQVQAESKAKLDFGIQSGVIDYDDIIKQQNEKKISVVDSFALQKKWLERNKDNIEQEVKILQILSGHVPADVKGVDVDAAYNYALSKIEEPTTQDMIDIARSIKAVIPTLQKEISDNLKYGNSQQAAVAAELYNALNPKDYQALSELDPESAAIARIIDRRVQYGGNAQQAAEQARRLVIDIDDSVRDRRQKEFDSFFKSKTVGLPPALSDDKIADMLEDEFGDFFGDEVDQQLTLDARELLQNNYLLTGDLDDAKEATLNLLNKSVGHTEFNGDTVMYLPPEKLYDVDSEILLEDFHADLEAEGFDSNEVFIQADPTLTPRHQKYLVVDKFGNPITKRTENGIELPVTWKFDKEAHLEYERSEVRATQEAIRSEQAKEKEAGQKLGIDSDLVPKEITDKGAAAIQEYLLSKDPESQSVPQKVWLEIKDNLDKLKEFGLEAYKSTMDLLGSMGEKALDILDSDNPYKKHQEDILNNYDKLESMKHDAIKSQRYDEASALLDLQSSLFEGLPMKDQKTPETIKVAGSLRNVDNMRAKAGPTVSLALDDAAQSIGVPAEVLYSIARVESNFNPNIKAQTSSATGLFQFIRSTWSSMVRKYGDQYNIKLGDIRDARSNAIMGALFIRDNIRSLQSFLGREPNVREIYLAHFSGIGGAKKVLRQLEKDPNAPAHVGFGRAAVRANPFIRGLTVAQAFNKLTNKVA